MPRPTEVPRLFDVAGIQYETFGRWPSRTVYLSAANQLLGTYAELTQVAANDADYRGWHAHHIVETQDLERLGVAHRFPSREAQACVLLPERAHIGRVNSVLRYQNPTRYSATADELWTAYGDAYALIGDYCGGGARDIRRELLAIVEAALTLAGLVVPRVGTVR